MTVLLLKGPSMENKMKLLNIKSESSVEQISEIAEFYNGCNILLTGGSGFIGKLLIDKLLRSCPRIQKLYFIIRVKKGKSIEERYRSHFEDALYDRLRKEQPDFLKKVVMIEGALDENGLTLSPENRELVKDSHIVFHGAASVRFEDKLRFAVNINVRGTKEILLLCEQMPNLKAVVYIGTAFSQCVNKLIDEIFYKPPIDHDNLSKLMNILNDKQLDACTPALIGEWPNTYAFTKVMAEDIVSKYIEKLPICIVRPSMMIPTAKEPVPGWIDNIYGPTGVTMGVGMGFLHTAYCIEDNVSDVIPADYVINNIIAAAWDIGTTWRAKPKQISLIPQNNKSENDEEKPPIYNSVTSVQNPITWKNYTFYNALYGSDVPSILTVWCYSFTNHKYFWLHKIYELLFHMFPAYIIDAVARFVGREPMLVKTFNKIQKFSTVISYFATQEWQFRNDNVLKLWDKMSPLDRKLFYFHVGELRWKQYFYNHVRGLRIYMAKDPLSTLDAARKRYFKLEILHYTVKTIFSLLLLRLIMAVLTSVYSFIVF